MDPRDALEARLVEACARDVRIVALFEGGVDVVGIEKH